MLAKLLFNLLPCLRKAVYALDNESILFEDLIASCDGKSNPIRHYSADELIRATKNFHHSCRINGDPWLYKGVLDNRLVIIMKKEDDLRRRRQEAIRDIIISMQMSTHKNVLKLLGCCLEFAVPALVLEYAPKGVLNSDGSYGDNESLPWKTRLCIAKKVANAVTYLHTAFPRPIIHRNLKPTCIFLDNGLVPRLSDFSHSITISQEQVHVDIDKMVATLGYIDPSSSCCAAFRITEKTDVYSFGVILLVFLTGGNACKEEAVVSYVQSHACDGQFLTIVDPKILGELGGEHEQAQRKQLQDFLALALLCTQEESESRPYMIDVAKELVRIEKSIIPC